MMNSRLSGVSFLLCLVLISASLLSIRAELLIGVFDAQNGHGMSQSLAMDKWQGKPNAIQTVFTTFDQSETTWLWAGITSIWTEGHKIPMITWEPKYWQQWSPTDITVKVTRGELDAYIVSWGQGLKGYIAGPDGIVGTADDRRAYLRFAHEMNGNWYPWSAIKGQTTPSDYVNMWKHVYHLFDSPQVGLPRRLVANSLLWVWSPIDFDVGDFKMDDYYPGDAFVDWVGLTGFNWGTSESWSGWWDPTRLFKDSIDRIRAIGGGKKPVAITEYSSVPNGGDKSQWIDQFFKMVLENDIRMACYFNLDKFEQSGMKYWSIFGDGGDVDFWDILGLRNYKGWNAYKRNINNKNIIGSDHDNSRVLTDDAFRGFIGSAPVKPPVMTSIETSTTTSSTNETPVPTPEETDSTTTPTDNKKSPKTLVAFNDDFGEAYDFMAWGSTDTITNPVFTPSAGSNIRVPEGKSFLKVHSTQWGGCGFFTRAQTSVDLTAFKSLRFNIANTEAVFIELQDVQGVKWKRVVNGSKDMSWRSVTLQLTPGPNDSEFDATKVMGVFLVTTHSETDFYIDSVFFQK